ncbi:MAG TPA: outer membrane beta-barrel protein [Gemmatimonadaceae bacterium]
MKRITLAVGTLAVLALSATTSSAQSAKAISIGISGGAAIPVGDLGEDYSTGYNGTLSLMFQSVGSPIGLRVDGMYNKLSAQDDRVVPLPDIILTSANANLTYALPGVGIRPYLIGGGGIYGYKSDVSGAETKTKFGVNGGIGASFPLSGFTTFIEARYHHIFTENQFGNSAPTQFVPVTFGISL